MPQGLSSSPELANPTPYQSQPEPPIRPSNARIIGALLCRRFQLNRHWPRGFRPFGAQSLRGLLLEFLSDLRTCFYRMGKRCKGLPMVYVGESIGPCFEQDASDNPLWNRRTLDCMRDIKSFEAAYSLATVFDVEVFHRGWEMGARWAESTACTSRQVERASENSPV
jgi:hypothetical protein